LSCCVNRNTLILLNLVSGQPLRELYRDEPFCREIFGVPDPARYSTAIFHDLLIIDEFAQNPDKTRRYHMLRDKVKHIPVGHQRLFLKRGEDGDRRRLVNENEVQVMLEAQGFYTIDVASMGIVDIVAACRGAEVMVSVLPSSL